jgi:hypothetical protein
MSLSVARLTLLFIFSLPVFTAAQAPSADQKAPPGKGIISGVVTAADTGKPLRDVNIAVNSVDGSPTRLQASVTDAQGRYEIIGLRTGRYMVSASKTGYLRLVYGQVRARENGRPLELSESTPLDKVDFVLPRTSVIVARVTDQFGDPVRGVVVRAYLPRFVNGRRQLSQAAAGGLLSSVTDDRGETRIFGLAPGDYYLAATPDFQTRWRGEVETLHPGTLDLKQAQTVRVGIGEEVFASFPILRSRPSTLSGRIVGSDGDPLTTPTVSLAQPQLSSGSSRRLNVTPDGSFHEENLAPGTYAITVQEPEYGSVRVQLLGDDVQGLIVSTKKSGFVRGRVTFDGAPPPKEGFEIGAAFDGEPPMIALSAGFIRSGGRVGTIPVTPESQWTFEAQIGGSGVLRARTANWMLKAVLLDGKDVTDTTLDFGAYTGKTVELVLTQRGAQVNGTVSNDRGQAVGDYVLILFPEDETQWTPLSRFFATGRPDQQGRVAINNLPPGRYLAAAVEYLEPGEERNPETLSRLRATSTAVALTEGESRSVTLRMSR